MLFSPVSWEVIPNTKIDLDEWEHVTCLKNVSLAYEGTRSGLKGYIAIGTNYNYGDDITSRGRVIIVVLDSRFSSIIRVVVDSYIRCHRSRAGTWTAAHQKQVQGNLCQGPKRSSYCSFTGEGFSDISSRPKGIPMITHFIN